MGTCTNCGCDKIGCGCKDSFLTSPPPCPTPVDCPEAQPCAEVFDAQCIVYTGADIICTPDVVVATDTNVADALNNIVDYLCNAFANFSILIAKVSCGTDEVIPNNSTVQEAFIAVVEYICDNLSIATNVTCGTDIISTSGTPIVDVLQDIVDYFCVPAKVFFHQQVVSDINIVAGAPSPGPDNYFFPIGYNTLTYTNTALTSKTFKVFVSYNTDTALAAVNVADFSNWVDGAIIKTATFVDIIAWESLGNQDLAGALFDGPNVGDIITVLTAEKVVTTPNINPVEFRFYNTRIPKNVSFYQVVTLAPNDAVSLKFKSKSGGVGRLLKAQIMVEEI
jgi:hypothetical protein